MKTLTITQPDDWHCHFRDDEYLTTTVTATARCFARAIAMPNLQAPVTTVADAKAYQQRILNAVPNSQHFAPLMTLYLTDNTTPDTIIEAKKSGFVKACKLYPAGATTNSSQGVTKIEAIYPTLATMEEQQFPLLIHGEVTDPSVDIFDREKAFIDTILTPLQTRFPKLPIVLEHVTTKDAVDFVLSMPDNVGATITVHHLLYNRNIMLVGGIKPDYYCLPILKRQQHQQALIDAATGGNKKFFLGTDSAPHTQSNKYTPCGCAGVFSAFSAIELYAEVFEQHNALERLEGFASHFGADFYGLTRNQNKITLEKKSWQIPVEYSFGKENVTPLCAGEMIAWQLRVL